MEKIPSLVVLEHCSVDGQEACLMKNKALMVITVDEPEMPMVAENDKATSKSITKTCIKDNTQLFSYYIPSEI